MRVDDATSSNANERSKKREGKGAAALPADAPLLTAVDTPSVLGKRRGCLLRVIADAAKVLGGHTAAMTGLRFDSRGRRLCSASKDGTARVWSVASGTELCVLPTTSGCRRSTTSTSDCSVRCVVPAPFRPLTTILCTRCRTLRSGHPTCRSGPSRRRRGKLVKYK